MTILRALTGLLILLPRERALRLCMWGSALLLDLAVLADLVTRHPLCSPLSPVRLSLGALAVTLVLVVLEAGFALRTRLGWVVALSLGVVLYATKTLADAELLYALVILAVAAVFFTEFEQRRLRHRSLKSATVWSLAHGLALGAWFLLFGAGVSEAVGTHAATPVETAVTSVVIFARSLPDLVLSVKVGLVAAMARAPLQYAFRHCLNAPGHHAVERLLLGLGIGLVLLGSAGQSELFSSGETCPVPDATLEALQASVNHWRQSAWVVLAGFGVAASAGALALFVSRMRWLSAVRRAQVPGWRIVAAGDASANVERVFVRLSQQALSEVLERNERGTWRPYARVPGAPFPERALGQ